jgi:hypothetical protein
MPGGSVANVNSKGSVNLLQDLFLFENSWRSAWTSLGKAFKRCKKEEKLESSVVTKKRGILFAK